MNERERALRVALVPQHPSCRAGMSVSDYVALGRVAHHGLFHAAQRARPRDRRDRSSNACRWSTFATRDVATLSGGERQRMVLARALTQSTMVVVLDEPITGLDLRHQMDMLELLKSEVHDCGLTVIATLHDLTLAGQFADRLVLLDGGRGRSRRTARGTVIRSDELADALRMNLRVVDVDGSDVVVPVRH